VVDKFSGNYSNLFFSDCPDRSLGTELLPIEVSASKNLIQVKENEPLITEETDCSEGVKLSRSQAGSENKFFHEKFLFPESCYCNTWDYFERFNNRFIEGGSEQIKAEILRFLQEERLGNTRSQILIDVGANTGQDVSFFAKIAPPNSKLFFFRAKSS